MEDDNWIGILDIMPVNLGHALLIPKTHARNLLDMEANLLKEAGPHLQTLAKAVKEATKADGINIIMNNESAAGQVIMHPHFHIIPRFKGDGREPWHNEVKPTPEELEEVKQKIKLAL